MGRTTVSTTQSVVLLTHCPRSVSQSVIIRCPSCSPSYLSLRHASTSPAMGHKSPATVLTTQTNRTRLCPAKSVLSAFHCCDIRSHKVWTIAERSTCQELKQHITLLAMDQATRQATSHGTRPVSLLCPANQYRHAVPHSVFIAYPITYPTCFLLPRSLRLFSSSSPRWPTAFLERSSAPAFSPCVDPVLATRRPLASHTPAT